MIPERYASYEKVVTIGAVNFTPAPGDKASNLAKIEANVREAAAQGVELVVFPEEAFTVICSAGEYPESHTPPGLASNRGGLRSGS